MTYKLQEFISKISSPVVLVIGGEERFCFENGESAYDKDYDHYYLVEDIRSVESKVYITLAENKSINDTSWCGEQEVSFF